MTANNISISISACHSSHWDMEYIFSFFVSGLALCSVSPIKCSRNDILGLLSVDIKRPWTSALVRGEPRHPVKKSYLSEDQGSETPFYKRVHVHKNWGPNWKLAPRSQSCVESILDRSCSSCCGCSYSYVYISTCTRIECRIKFIWVLSLYLSFKFIFPLDRNKIL